MNAIDSKLAKDYFSYYWFHLFIALFEAGLIITSECAFGCKTNCRHLADL